MNKNRKLIIGLVAASVVAFAIALMARQWSKSPKSSAPVEQWHYVAVSRDVAAGERLTADMLVITTWTNSVPVVGALDAIDKAAGHTAALPLRKGTVVTDQLLTPPNAAVDLSQKIPVGMRAIAIRTDPVTDFSGFLVPDARVDVLMTTMSASGDASHSMSAIPDQTVTILENIQVLSTGKQIVADPSGKPQEEQVVSLLVTPEDARKVALGQEHGKIHLVLRNSDDVESPVRVEAAENHKSPATFLMDLAVTRALVVEAPPRPLKTVKPFPEIKPLDQLEIVLGTKHYTQGYRNNKPVGDPVEVGGGNK